MQTKIKYFLVPLLILFASTVFAKNKPVKHSHHRTTTHHSNHHITHHTKIHSTHSHHAHHQKQHVTYYHAEAPIPDINLQDYQNNSQSVQNLIANAFKLNQLHLHYVFGSDDPRRHGMDCSGTINYLLKNARLENTPRRSDELYDWTRNNGTLYPVDSTDFQSYEFSKLKPGDLLFWASTYKTHHDYNVTHVMLYLGKNELGQPLMFGASEKHDRWGVRVFDFNAAEHGSGRFVGYSCIPNLTCDDNDYALNSPPQIPEIKAPDVK